MCGSGSPREFRNLSYSEFRLLPNLEFHIQIFLPNTQRRQEGINAVKDIRLSSSKWLRQRPQKLGNCMFSYYFKNCKIKNKDKNDYNAGYALRSLFY